MHFQLTFSMNLLCKLKIGRSFNILAIFSNLFAINLSVFFCFVINVFDLIMLDLEIRHEHNQCDYEMGSSSNSIVIWYSNL